MTPALVVVDPRPQESVAWARVRSPPSPVAVVVWATPRPVLVFIIIVLTLLKHLHLLLHPLDGSSPPYPFLRLICEAVLFEVCLRASSVVRPCPG